MDHECDASEETLRVCSIPDRESDCRRRTRHERQDISLRPRQSGPLSTLRWISLLHTEVASAVRLAGPILSYWRSIWINISLCFFFFFFALPCAHHIVQTQNLELPAQSNHMDAFDQHRNGCDATKHVRRSQACSIG